MESSRGIRTLNILHFNDSYNIEPSKTEPVGGVSRFATALKSFEKTNPVLFFSGDLFSPSNLGNVYRGKQMVDPVNALKITAACIGNHDFDYDLDEAEGLLRSTNFPWLLTNMTYPNGSQIAGTLSHYIIDHSGIKIGLIGLGEYQWIETLNCLTPDDIKYEDFVTCANRFAKKLREEDNCDLVIALTHMRDPRDFLLAETAEGVDLVLGGHDHERLIEQRGGVYVIKCAGDFREFNHIQLRLLSPEMVEEIQKDPTKFPELPVDKLLRNRLFVDINTVIIDSKWEPDQEVDKYVTRDLLAFEESMNKIVGFTDCPLDCRFTKIRSEGTNASEIIADISRIATESDVCLLNSGTLRIDSIINEGPIRLKEIFGMLPFIDPVIKLEVTGKQLLAALENGVSQYPAYEGRFPMLSGATFAFDPKKPKNERVIPESVRVGDVPLDLEKTYVVATKYFLSEGKDGYEMFADCKKLNSEETAPALRQELLEFFQMVSVPECQEYLDLIRRLSLQASDSNSVSLKRKESQGYKKKMEKYAKLATLIKGTVEEGGEKYIKIAPKHENRIQRLD